MKYASQKKGKECMSVVQASVESFNTQKKDDGSQISRIKGRLLTRGLPTNRSVRSVVQNAQI